ncbi:MAG: hypothetical protein Q9223_002631 [Gallowayella weberi]
MSRQPLLCEPPLPFDKDLSQELSGPLKTHRYPTSKYIESMFRTFGGSILPDPEKGLLRHDVFSMIALEPREEWLINVSMGELDEDDRPVPSSLDWAMWGIIDGHAGGYTAYIVKDILPDYVIEELFLRAGINPHSPYREMETIFQKNSVEDTVQAITHAFLRLDNDILKLATQAITGSKSFEASMQDLSLSDSGSCALLAMWDTTSGYLHVANVGNSRAVLGRRNVHGTWEARPLSTDQTSCNEDEVARLRSEHPDEPDMIKDERLLGSAVTRAFGDLRWKLSAHLQSIAQTRFFGRPLLPFLLSPPYLTAEPQITTTKIDPRDNDFLILASDGFWGHISSEQAVQLVGRWLTKNDPATPPGQRSDMNTVVIREDGESDNAKIIESRERLGEEGHVRSPPPCAVKNREYTKVKRGDEKNWVVVDKNAATHLARNAMGGADEDMFCALVGGSAIYPMRRLR